MRPWPLSETGCLQKKLHFPKSNSPLGDRLCEGLPSLASQSLPVAPGVSQRVTRRDTRPLYLARGPGEAGSPRPGLPEAAAGSAPQRGLLLHPWGAAAPVELWERAPPGPFRAKLRDGSVPVERVCKRGRRKGTRDGRGAGTNSEREQLRVSGRRGPAPPGPQRHRPPRRAGAGPFAVPGRPPAAALRDDRPSVCPSVCQGFRGAPQDRCW